MDSDALHQGPGLWRDGDAAAHGPGGHCRRWPGLHSRSARLWRWGSAACGPGAGRVPRVRGHGPRLNHGHDDDGPAGGGRLGPAAGCGEAEPPVAPGVGGPHGAGLQRKVLRGVRGHACLRAIPPRRLATTAPEGPQALDLCGCGSGNSLPCVGDCSRAGAHRRPSSGDE